MLIKFSEECNLPPPTTPIHEYNNLDKDTNIAYKEINTTMFNTLFQVLCQYILLLPYQYS